MQSLSLFVVFRAISSAICSCYLLTVFPTVCICSLGHMVCRCRQEKNWNSIMQWTVYFSPTLNWRSVVLSYWLFLWFLVVFGYIYNFVILFEFWRVFIGRSHVSSTSKMQMCLGLFETSMLKHFYENCWKIKAVFVPISFVIDVLDGPKYASLEHIALSFI